MDEGGETFLMHLAFSQIYFYCDSQFPTNWPSFQLDQIFCLKKLRIIR